MTWLDIGATAQEAYVLVRLQPIWGDQDAVGSPLDFVDMSNVTVDGTEFDQAMADLSSFASGPPSAVPGYLRDDSGDIYDASGQLIFTADQLANLDPNLAAEIAAQTRPSSQYFWDPAANAVMDGQGNVVATARDLQAAGIDPATLTEEPPSQPGLLEPTTAAGAGTVQAGQDTQAGGPAAGTPEKTPSPSIINSLVNGLKALGIPAGIAAGLAPALATLGVGGAGLAAGQLIGGGPTSYTPTLGQPTPGQAVADAAVGSPEGSADLAATIKKSLAGQSSLADYVNALTRAAGTRATSQAPTITDIQNRALSSIAANMPGTGAVPETTAGLRDLLLKALAGQDNPELAREFERQIEVMRNLGAIRGGPGAGASYFESSPGIEAASSLAESQNIQRYTDYLNTINAMAPQYNAARQLDKTIAGQTLRENVDLSQLGATPPNTLAGVYNTMTPIPAIGQFGANPSLANANMLNQATLASVNARRANRQSLAAGVGDLIGKVANAAGVLG